jgi:hypothetical protein
MIVIGLFVSPQIKSSIMKVILQLSVMAVCMMRMSEGKAIPANITNLFDQLNTIQETQEQVGKETEHFLVDTLYENLRDVTEEKLNNGTAQTKERIAPFLKGKFARQLIPVINGTKVAARNLLFLDQVVRILEDALLRQLEIMKFLMRIQKEVDGVEKDTDEELSTRKSDLLAAGRAAGQRIKLNTAFAFQDIDRAEKVINNFKLYYALLP